MKSSSILQGAPSDHLDHSEVGMIPCEQCQGQLSNYLTLVGNCIITIHLNQGLLQQLPQDADGQPASMYLLQ